MADYNKVLLMGNLTRDPELRYSGGGQGGSAICKFGLAVNRKYRLQSGDQQEETCFVDITVFGRQAETCNEYLSKGRPVFVEGRLNFSTWEDRETGQRRSKLDVVGERVQFLGGRSDGQGGGGGGSRRESSGYGGGGGGQRDRAPQQQRTPPPQQREASAPAGIDYDDIPF